ncbi:MAG TPA: PepSY-like domain-containing protein [Gemmataceae bacterium]|nr:PepSY-like domain-containing protein [Gemmataceae bacterium]
MTRLNKMLAVALAVALALSVGFTQAAQEKVPLDKLPKEVTDAVKAKFPMADIKRATKETEGGKTVYEVIFNNDKLHLHAIVTGEGKLTEIHRHVDLKDVPATVVKAVEAKYPKAKIDEGVHERSDPNGKVIGYEITVEISAGNSVEVVTDANGKIEKETKLDAPKKGG